jgi:PIN like domain
VSAAPTLLFDENFPQSIPRALREFDYAAQHTLEHLAKGTPDEAVFKFLRERGWFWVSHDRRVKRNPHQRAALLTADIGAFILTGSVQRTAREMMTFMLECIDEIILRAARVNRPFIIGVSDRLKFDRLA